MQSAFLILRGYKKGLHHIPAVKFDTGILIHAFLLTHKIKVKDVKETQIVLLKVHMQTGTTGIRKSIRVLMIHITI